MKEFIKFTGFVNIAAGLLLIAFWYLYAILLPYRQLSTTLSILVLDRDWVFVNILGVSGTIFGLIGLIGIYLKIIDVTGRLGLAGFVIAFLGTALLLGTLLWDTVVWPILANYDSTLLDFQGPIYTSKTFVPFFIVSGLFYALGYLLVGLAVARSGIFPNWSGIFLAVGAPLFGLGALFGQLQVVPRSIGITLMGMALIGLGRILVR